MTFHSRLEQVSILNFHSKPRHRVGHQPRRFFVSGFAVLNVTSRRGGTPPLSRFDLVNSFTDVPLPPPSRAHRGAPCPDTRVYGSGTHRVRYPVNRRSFLRRISSK